ncbi:MAG TPA: NADH-quinone oxidoreductase subunit N [Holophagaceae bacterium]|nr:NADH-quinone oxidoreductase subunit N [Holophagaceae bacterium]
MTTFSQGLWDSLMQGAPLIWPQILLVIVATLMLWPGDLFFAKGEKHKWAPIAFLALLLSGVLIFLGKPGEGFSGMYRVDGLARGFQAIVILSALAAVALSQRALNALREQTVEYYSLILFATAGMLFLCGATDIVSVYFSLELMALCFYILVGYFRTQNRGVEAGMKYYLLGAFSSAIFIYGVSLLFMATGGLVTNLAELGQKLPLVEQGNSLLVFGGVLFILVGMCFKVAAAPFHQWSPDVYDGAPTPITAFMSTAPKAAALAAFLRIFGTAFHNLQGDWSLPLQFVAAASMILGNVAAIRQQSMKRMLAYSGIAHAGYMLMGVISSNLASDSPLGDPATQAVWLYALIYLFMSTGAFAIVIHIQKGGQGERIDDLRGLGKKRPGLAFAMLIFMFSMAGIPPLAGFFTKFYLFNIAVQNGLIGLVVIAVLTSAVSAFYYLWVIRQMYFHEGGAEVEAPGTATSMIVTMACAVTLLATCFGPMLLEWAGRIGWI